MARRSAPCGHEISVSRTSPTAKTGLVAGDSMPPISSFRLHHLKRVRGFVPARRSRAFPLQHRSSVPQSHSTRSLESRKPSASEHERRRFLPCLRVENETGWRSQSRAHQRSADGLASLKDRFVRASRQSLGNDRIRIESLFGRFWDEADVEVLVEFQPHVETGSVGMGTMRSRVISAANANAARMSSG